MAALMLCEPRARSPELMEREFAESTAEQPVLVARALRGDQDAFAAIFNRYSGLMLYTAYRIVKDRNSAEDAVQNAFIQAWQHLPSLRETGAFHSWLLHIVVNQSISCNRRLARSTMVLDQSFSEQESFLASEAADDARGCLESSWDLAQAVEKLPTKQQHIIALHYYQGMTLPEVAQRMHISENTLKKRVQAALSNLRRVLGDGEID